MKPINASAANNTPHSQNLREGVGLGADAAAAAFGAAVLAAAAGVVAAASTTVAVSVGKVSPG